MKLSFRIFLKEQIGKLRRFRIGLPKSRIAQAIAEYLLSALCGIMLGVWVKGLVGATLVILCLGFGVLRYYFRYWQSMKEVETE
jgi:hypothetical protein